MCRQSRYWLVNLKITDGTPPKTQEDFEEELFQEMLNDPEWKAAMRAEMEQMDKEIIQGIINQGITNGLHQR